MMTSKARILFVDDEKRVLNAMRGLFRRDYELYLTTEGAEAVRLAAEHDVDVIVADQRMPGMSGIEVLGSVKQQSPRTVRILLTGYADPSAVEGSINIGEVFRFLSKPCPPQTLKDTLALAIDAARTSADTRTEPPRDSATPQPAAKPAASLPAAPAPTQPAAQAPTSAPSRPPVAATPPQPARPTESPSSPPSAGTIADEDDTEPSLEVLKEGSPPPTSPWQSVTSVVMSKDAVEETRSSQTLGSARSEMNDVGVVVFTIDSEFAATVIRAMPAKRTTLVATTLIKVAEAVVEQNAGVLITDFTQNKVTLQRIIGALKRHRPELVTIAVSDGRDTTDMINLINYGQVFRYVLKPLEPDALLNDINAAVIRHLYLLRNPEAVKRHEVVTSPAAGNTSETFSQFLGQIRRKPTRRDDPGTTQ